MLITNECISSDNDIIYNSIKLGSFFDIILYIFDTVGVFDL